MRRPLMTRAGWSTAGALAAWCGAAFAALRLQDLPYDFGHGICGPWGCGPPLQALVACHGFWLVNLAALLWVSHRWLPVDWQRRVANLCLLIAATGLLGVAAHQALHWWPHATQGSRPYVVQRFLFSVASLVDVPLVPLALFGIAGRLLPRRRMIHDADRDGTAADPLNGLEQQRPVAAGAPGTGRSRRRVLLLPLLAVLVVAAGARTWQASSPAVNAPVRAAAGVAQVARARSPLDVFDLSNATAPRERILPGGPPVDGIPALTSPKFVASDRAEFLQPADRVIGVVVGTEARAYPLRILDYHEVVNDHIGGAAFAVTYCPLCDSAAVFERRQRDEESEFGVSGLLLNSNVLLYDRRPAGRSSLWSQVKSASISGPRAGETLQTLPLELTSWDDWRTRHPQTRVLSTDTRHKRDYHRTPYRNYFTSSELTFPVEPLDRRLPPKTPVLGVWGPGTQRAYAASTFASRREQVWLEQRLDGRKFTLVYDPRWKSLRVADADAGLEWMYSFWFAWAAFRQQTEVFEAPDGT